MQQKNHYTILGVAASATSEEIKAAYRLLAKKFHPDKNAGNKVAEEKFKELQHAYSVLSNQEKRKKYDLKMAYGTPYARTKQNNQYSGNAYQYAQQQAKQSQQKRPEYSRPKQNRSKRGKTEGHQILVSVGIAFILLYFIVSYNSGKRRSAMRAAADELVEYNDSVNQLNAQQTKIEKTTAGILEDFDSPYTDFFGSGIFNESSFNSITIRNSKECEAIVCVVEKAGSMKTIRNKYLDAGSIYKIENIPDGDYFIKIYFGSNWDTSKTFINKKVKGGFRNERGFIEMKAEKEIFKMKQKNTSSGASFSSYDISIDPRKENSVNEITAQEFFK